MWKRGIATMYRVVLAASVLAAAVFFQNCTPTKTSGTSSATLQSNGDSYSGKTFNDYATCPTGNVRASIQVAEARYLLTREQCAPVDPPRPLDAALVERVNGALRYDGRVFVDADQTQAAGPVCGYPVYTGPLNGTDCSGIQTPRLNQVDATPVADGYTYVFAIYNAVNASSSTSTRQIASQPVTLGTAHPAGSVDLVLSSYEPVVWALRGNVAAVRSVHVLGTSCATVTGVDLAKVRVKTDENVFGERLPLSSNLVSSLGVYEGSCRALATP